VITLAVLALLTAGVGLILGSNRFFFGGMAALAVLAVLIFLP
jgi:hypothetical protein